MLKLAAAAKKMPSALLFYLRKLGRACRDSYKSVIRRSSCTRTHTQTYPTHRHAYTHVYMNYPMAAV